MPEYNITENMVCAGYEAGGRFLSGKYVKLLTLNFQKALLHEFIIKMTREYRTHQDLKYFFFYTAVTCFTFSGLSE